MGAAIQTESPSNDSHQSHGSMPVRTLRAVRVRQRIEVLTIAFSLLESFKLQLVCVYPRERERFLDFLTILRVVVFGLLGHLDLAHDLMVEAATLRHLLHESTETPSF